MTDECTLSYLECGHVFHQKCLNRWIPTAKTCPECRIVLRTAPHRLYLHFTVQPDFAELRQEISQKNGLLEKTITRMTEKDETLRICLLAIKQLSSASIQSKRVISEMKASKLLLTAKTIQLMHKLKEQHEQQEILSEAVKSLSAREDSLNEKLRENRTTIDRMTDTISMLEKTQADRIIENYQLELEKTELSTRLDQFRAEFVRANNELQQAKSDNENLRNELTVHKAGKPEIVEMNFNLTTKLDKTEETLHVMRNENIAMRMPYATEAKISKLRNDYPSLIPTIPVPSRGEAETHTRTNLSRAAMPKRKIGEIIGIVSDAKRQKRMEPHSKAKYVSKIVMEKSSVGWSIVARSEGH